MYVGRALPPKNGRLTITARRVFTREYLAAPSARALSTPTELHTIMQRSTLSLCTGILLTIAAATSARAQQTPNGWDSLDLGQRSGFRDDRSSSAGVWFDDSLNGYIRSDTSYRTTNGGLTWTVMSSKYIPRQGVMVDSMFGYNGWMVTTDGGQRYSYLPFDPSDPILKASYPLSIVAANERNAVGFITSGYPAFDSLLGQVRNSSVFRFVHTTDRGATWRALDSIRVRHSAGRPIVDIGSVIGEPLPSPWPYDDSRFGWVRPIDMPDSQHVRVVAFAFGPLSSPSSARYQYYIGTIDLVTGAAVWHPMPVWHGRELNGTEGYMVMGADADHFIVGEIDSTNNGIDDRPYWLTTDGGVTWDSIAHTAGLVTSQLSFLEDSIVVAINGISTDRGRTWQMREQPWFASDLRDVLYAGAFAAPDPMHRFIANSYSLFARSSDGGLTWSRNAAGGKPRAMLANGDHVVIAREYQSVLWSRDRGITWHDAHDDRGVPRDLQSIVAMSYADRASGIDAVVGLGRFIALDGRRTLEVLRSTNGGASWTRGGIFPDSLGGRVTLHAAPRGGSTHVIVTTDHGVWTSDDAGATWTNRDDDVAFSIAMADADHGIAFFYRRQLATTSDGGSTWVPALDAQTERASTMAVAVLGTNEYRAIGINRDQSAIIVDRSTDRGATWTLLNRQSIGASDVQPRGAVVAFWIDSSRVYVATPSPSTLYYSRDAGRTFEVVRLPFSQFTLARDDRYLYLSAAGNVAARIDLAVEPSGVEVLPTPAGGIHVTIAGDRLEVALDGGGGAEISIIDLAGALHAHQRVEGGSTTLDLANLASGRYFVQVVRGSAVAIEPFAVVR
jgi:photosystem II stability/assembly factor-like uncharacterized protein